MKNREAAQIAAVLLSKSRITYVPERSSDGVDGATKKEGSTQRIRKKALLSMSCLLFLTKAQAPTRGAHHASESPGTRLASTIVGFVPSISGETVEVGIAVSLTVVQHRYETPLRRCWCFDGGVIFRDSTGWCI